MVASHSKPQIPGLISPHSWCEPVISVDTKKKELVGNFANPGQEWQPKGEPVEVNVHDFCDPDLGKASPPGLCR